MQTNQNQQQEFNEYALKVIRHKAKQLIGKAGYTESDRSDLEQEMMLDVLERLPKFNPSKGTHKTFITRIIEHKISKLIRHRTLEMRDYRREEYPLDEHVDDGAGSTVLHSDLIPEANVASRFCKRKRTFAEEVDLVCDVEVVINRLPEKLRCICEMLKTGTAADVSRSTKIPRTTLNWHLKKLRQVFENSGLRNYL